MVIQILLVQINLCLVSYHQPGEEFVDLVSASDALSLHQYKTFSMRIFRSVTKTSTTNTPTPTNTTTKTCYHHLPATPKQPPPSPPPATNTIPSITTITTPNTRANFKGKRLLTREMANPLRVYRKAIPCPKAVYNMRGTGNEVILSARKSWNL